MEEEEVVLEEEEVVLETVLETVLEEVVLEEEEVVLEEEEVVLEEEEVLEEEVLDLQENQGILVEAYDPRFFMFSKNETAVWEEKQSINIELKPSNHIFQMYS